MVGFSGFESISSRPVLDDPDSNGNYSVKTPNGWELANINSYQGFCMTVYGPEWRNNKGAIKPFYYKRSTKRFYILCRINYNSGEGDQNSVSILDAFDLQLANGNGGNSNILGDGTLREIYDLSSTTGWCSLGFMNVQYHDDYINDNVVVSPIIEVLANQNSEQGINDEEVSIEFALSDKDDETPERGSNIYFSKFSPKSNIEFQQGPLNVTPNIYVGTNISAGFELVTTASISKKMLFYLDKTNYMTITSIGNYGEIPRPLYGNITGMSVKTRYLNTNKIPWMELNFNMRF